MKKILFIHHGLGIGGAFISLQNLVKSIDTSKYEVIVLFIKDKSGFQIFKDFGINADIIDNKVYKKRYRYFSHFETSFIKWYQLPLLLKTLVSWIYTALYFGPKIIESYNPDLVYLNSSVLSDWAFAAKRRNKKVIVHIRETFTKGYFGIRLSLINRLINKYSDFIISISNYNIDKLGISKNYRVVYNYVSDNYCQIKDNTNYKRKVLYLGGYSYIKGFITLVNSLEFLNNNIKIVIAGYIPTSSNYSIKHKIKNLFYPHSQMSKSLKKLLKSDIVEIRGITNNVIELFQDVDLLVSPFSKAHFSRPIIEAFSSKRAVITSDIGGVDEVVKDNVNGFVFKKDNSFDLANKINQFYLTENINRNERVVNQAYNDSIIKYTSKNILQIEEVIDLFLK